MSNLSRKEKIASFGKAYDALEDVLDSIPESMWKFKPSDKEWSIHEVIIHLADIEANVTVRLLKALAEPGGTIMPLDQDVWANNLYYLQQDTDTALQVYKWLREKNFRLLEFLPAEKWNNYMNHPESGKVDLDSWLNNYEKHGWLHIDQVKRVYRQWQEQQVPQKENS